MNEQVALRIARLLYANTPNQIIHFYDISEEEVILIYKLKRYFEVATINNLKRKEKNGKTTC